MINQSEGMRFQIRNWQIPHSGRGTIKSPAQAFRLGRLTRLMIRSKTHEAQRTARFWQLLCATILMFSRLIHAEQIGEVDTAFKLLGPNHKIVIEAFDDPKIEGVTCHISRSKTGGIKGGLGMAEDTADAAIACRQVGAIRFSTELKDGEKVFSERRSLLFKELNVVRFYDRKRNTLVYLVYSEKLIEGSPKNSISTVPIMAWPSAR
jgi:CreA protein